MAELIRRASAGTMESSDVYVEVLPGDCGIQLHLESIVEEQFGDAIRTTVLEQLAALEIANVNIRVVDKGALDCVLRARVETAVRRGKGEV